MESVMKVVVVLEIDVNPQAWSDVYGTDTAAAATRTDVKDYVLNQVAQSPGVLESTARVSLR
jgi:hypothetical protein